MPCRMPWKTPMKVNVLFFAELRETFGSHRLVDVAEGSTIGEVTDLFARESGRFSLQKPSLIYAVNENFETIEKELADQDQLAIMTPMAGG